MKKLSLFIASAAFLVACNNSENTKEETVTEEVVVVEEVVATNNYAVVWHWITDDAALVEANVVEQSKQLNDFWQKGVVENVYYDSDPTNEKLGNFPMISFFIKEVSMDKAKALLDEMTFVKKGISEYTIHPVGLRWLTRNEEAIADHGITNSFVSVWTTTADFNSEASKAEIEENAKAQTDAIMELWNKGLVENVYFDLESGAFRNNETTDFVMFVNANTEEKARKYLSDLPFSKKNIAQYQLFDVGVFWMGENEEAK